MALRLSAIACAPGCVDTAVRLATGCRIAGELDWCVVGCLCWSLGAAALLAPPSYTSCTPGSVKWSGLISCALQAGERNMATPRPTKIMGIFNIPKDFIRDLRLSLDLGPGNY